MVWSTWCLLNYGRKAGRPSWNIGHKTIISHVASFRDLFKVRSVICYNAYRLRRLGKLPKLSFLVFLTLEDISGKGCQSAAVVIVRFPADQSKMMETHRKTSYKLMQREALHKDDFTWLYCFPLASQFLCFVPWIFSSWSIIFRSSSLLLYIQHVYLLIATNILVPSSLNFDMTQAV